MCWQVSISGDDDTSEVYIIIYYNLNNFICVFVHHVMLFIIKNILIKLYLEYNMSMPD